jgi:uncharacterized delta-60 repeat protein
MISTGKLKNRRRGVWLLCILFSLALACLVCAEAAESRASDGRYVAKDWARRHKGPAIAHDMDKALALDAQGNVYTTGTAKSDTGLPEILTIKYSPDGRKLWDRRYHKPPMAVSYAVGLAVDGQGNVLVTGYSTNSNPHWPQGNFVTIKYDGNGQLLWEGFYNGPFGGVNGATAITLDGQGHVYVTGVSYGATGFNDYTTIKYSPDGEELWVRRYSGPGTGDNHPYALAVDGQGNVCVTGTSRGSGTGDDYATVKYNPEGEELWVRRYNGTGNNYDSATAIAIDGQGNVYVTGASDGLGIRYDYATIKYNPEGQRLWVRRYKGPGDRRDRASAIAVDAQGNVLITGESGGDFATIKYSPAGKRLWVRRYNGPGNSDDSATAMALDGQGNIYVTGGSVGLNTHFDYATIKYSPDGRRLWLRRYNGPNGSDSPMGLAVDGQGNVYVTGYSLGSAGDDFLTIKYTQTP